LALPLASTAPIALNGGTGTAIQYGAEGTGSPNATPPFTNWSPGQSGDGYSWIVQILPFMEESVLYDKLTQANATGNPVRYGKLQDAAFQQNGPVQSPGTTPSTTNPYIFATKIPGLVCPSFPGEDDQPVANFGSSWKATNGTGKVGSGNYVALAATHYYTTAPQLASGLPTSAAATTTTGCTGAYCGNGGLPFPGLVGGKIQSKGLGFQSLSDGTSKVALITETREEVRSSWYSGLASYVVGAWPQGDLPKGSPATTPPTTVFWTCSGNCDTALNKGDTKGNSSKYYEKTDPHGGATPVQRIWGPSSRHPSIVLHGYADGHSTAVNDNINPDVYLHMITRNGREVDSQ
jgi:hypothetical protein